MKRVIYTLLIVVFTIGVLGSCKKHEVIFDHPFIYVTDNGDGLSNSAEVYCMSTLQTSYAVILSTKTLDEDLIVNYELVPGDGLKEGVDYELLSPKTLIFPIGLYKNVIHIKWLSNEIDGSVDENDKPIKDNTVKIVIKDNSKNFTIGYPGPAKNNSFYTIKKTN